MAINKPIIILIINFNIKSISVLFNFDDLAFQL